MNYEKKYKEAQGWIEKIYPTLQHEQQMEAEAFFPELKESENERIRKAIINVFSTHKDYEMFFGASVEDIRTWLEKQGEQKASYTTIAETGNGGINALVTGELSNSCDYKEKPVGKVEPKFHSGEWITNGDYTWKIIDVKPLDYILQSQDGNIVDDTISHIDEQFNLWTIQDAKDGDVLAYGDNPNDCHVEVTMIFKSVRNEKSAFTHFHFFDDKFRVNDWCDCGKNAHPATKEQRDLLFQKMKEAGYEWDAEKRELKLLITNGGDFESENCEQKPAWSEEDEVKINRIVACLENLNVADNDILLKDVDWLKSLKTRVQPKQDWSEEDEILLKLSLENLTELKDRFGEYYGRVGGCIDWLKSLKPQKQ